MSTNNDNSVASVHHVGTPPPNFQAWTTNTVYFHGFADLNLKEVKTVESRPFQSLGVEWRVQVKLHEPRCILQFVLQQLKSSRSIPPLNTITSTSIDCHISVNGFIEDNALGSTGSTFPFGDGHFGIEVHHNIALSTLVDGALVVDVRMKPLPRDMYPPFIPVNPSSAGFARLFNDKESADVVFEVGGKLMQSDNESRQKAARTKTRCFYAHSLILKKVAPLLADFCKSADPNTTVQISNMLPGTFWILLCYIYGGRTPRFASSESIKDVIKAADRFGVINLKLEVEVHYVSSLTLTLDNVMENLHFADSNNCALLKESVMDYIIKNKVEMLEKKVLSDAIIEGLGSDILAAIIRGEKKDGVAESHEDNFNAMSVSELRCRAYWSRLDVDGSREMLIAALDKKKSDLRSLESNKQK